MWALNIPKWGISVLKWVFSKPTIDDEFTESVPLLLLKNDPIVMGTISRHCVHQHFTFFEAAAYNGYEQLTSNITGEICFYWLPLLEHTLTLTQVGFSFHHRVLSEVNLWSVTQVWIISVAQISSVMWMGCEVLSRHFHSLKHASYFVCRRHTTCRKAVNIANLTYTTT